MATFVASKWSLSLTSITIVVSYIFAVIIYRLTLHPLAKYPGPFLAKITGWYGAWHACRGRRHIDQRRCHEIYGPVVRWGPDYMMFNTPSALQTIYGDSRSNNVRKADVYTYFNDGKEKPSTITTLDKGPQGRKRRILSHAFSEPARRQSDQFIIENVDRWCDLLGRTGGQQDQGWGGAKDMTQYCDWLAFDIAMHLAFGKSYKLVENPELRFLPMYIMAGFRGLCSVGHSPILKYWQYVARSGLNRILEPGEFKKRDTFLSFTLKAIQERTAHENEEAEKQDTQGIKDYFYWLSRAVDSETKEGYKIEEIQAECALLMSAGSNGPAFVLAAAFFYLTRYPTVLERLISEVRTMFASSEEIITGPKMTECVYLRAVLEEALRLTPAIFGVLPRQVMAGGQVVDGVFLPEGTVLGTSAYAIHHNSEYFPNPNGFRPERWIADDQSGVTAESVQRAKSAFFAFSLGGSGCIGKQIAYQQMSITLARTLFRYDIRAKPGDSIGAGGPHLEEGRKNPLEFQVDDVFSILTEGPMVEFRIRK